MRLTYDTEILEKVGTNGATLYEFLRYWCSKSKNVFEGRRWIYQRITDFEEAFPNMSKNTIKRNLRKLEDEGLILTGNFNKVKFDHTKWYAICGSIEEPKMGSSKNPKRVDRKTQSGSTDSPKMGRSERPKMGRSEEPKMGLTIPINKQLTNIDEIYIGIEPTFNEILNSYSVIKDNEDLKETFVEFIKLRKKSKNPLTAKGLKLNINKALELGGNDPTRTRLVVEQTIANGWRGMFPLKEEKSGTKINAQDKNPFRELMRKEGLFE